MHMRCFHLYCYKSFKLHVFDYFPIITSWRKSPVDCFCHHISQRKTFDTFAGNFCDQAKRCDCISLWSYFAMS